MNAFFFNYFNHCSAYLYTTYNKFGKLEVKHKKFFLFLQNIFYFKESKYNFSISFYAILEKIIFLNETK